MEGGLTYRHFRNFATTPSKIYPEHKGSTAKFNEHQPIIMASANNRNQNCCTLTMLKEKVVDNYKQCFQYKYIVFSTAGRCTLFCCQGQKFETREIAESPAISKNGSVLTMTSEKLRSWSWNGGYLPIIFSNLHPVLNYIYLGMLFSILH